MIDEDVFPHNAALPEEQSPEIHACPGVQYLTLCPEGYYCDTPVEIQKCPLNHFCALGSDAASAVPVVRQLYERGHDAA